MNTINSHINNYISEHQVCLQSDYDSYPCYCNKVLNKWLQLFDAYKP